MAWTAWRLLAEGSTGLMRISTTVVPPVTNCQSGALVVEADA